MKNKFIIPAVALVLAGSVYATSIYAQDQANGNSTIVQKLAQKFGLKESDVQAVFDEEREQHLQNMHARFEEKLTEAVNEGKLTEAQKQLIIAKKTELMSKHQVNKENWQNDKQELESWAKENGIDPQYLFGTFMGGAKGMRHMWFKK